MTFIIIGIILIIIGVICFRKRKQAQYNLTSFMIVRESSIKDLKSEFSEVSKGIGKGHYKQLIGLHGTIESPNPLKAELSQKPCVKYRTLITRDWEEKYKEQDQNGRWVTRTQTGYDTVVHQEHEQPFYVNDGTGTIGVSPRDAQIDLEQVTNRYERGDRHHGRSSIVFGGQVINLLQNLSSSRRILGYRYQEWVLPLARRVFIYGEVTDFGGELTFQKPSDTEKPEPYIISFKSKSELSGKTTQKIKTLFFCGVGGVVLGIILLLWGLTQV